MLHLPFSRHENNGDLVLGRLWKLPISPLVRVTASARTAHLYVIDMSGRTNPSCWSTASCETDWLVDSLVSIGLELINQR